MTEDCSGNPREEAFSELDRSGLKERLEKIGPRDALTRAWLLALADLREQYVSFDIVARLVELDLKCRDAMLMETSSLKNCHQDVQELERTIWSLYCPDSSVFQTLLPLQDMQVASAHVVRDVSPVSSHKFGWQPVSTNDLRSILAIDVYYNKSYREIEKLDAGNLEVLPAVLQLLGAYPPLRLTLALNQLEELLSLCELSGEAYLAPDGGLLKYQVASAACAVALQLQEIQRVAAEVFVDVPTLDEALARYGLAQPPHESEAPFKRGLPALQETALTLHGMRRLFDLRHSNVSWVERANLFSHSQTKEREGKAHTAVDALQARLRDLWAQVVKEASAERHREEGTCVGDACIAVVTTIESLGTQPGTSPSVKDCTVLHGDEARERLQAARQSLRAPHDLPTAFEELVDAALSSTPGHGDLPALLAEAVGPTVIRESLENCRKLRLEKERAHAAAAQALTGLTYFDFFSRIFMSNEKLDRSRLAQEKLKNVEQELKNAEVEHIRLFAEPLRKFPTAYLYYSTAPLEGRLDMVWAVCRQRYEVVGTDLSGNARRKRVYSCELVGVESAREAARAYGERVFSLYGSGPGLYAWMLAKVTDYPRLEQVTKAAPGK